MRTSEIPKPARRPDSPRVTLSLGTATLSLYLCFSFLFFGRAIAGHCFDYYIGRDTDPSLYMWSLAWWPYVLQHHAHPFLTKLIWAPQGINLAWVTCLPLLGIIATPLTTMLGPLASFNLTILILPPLAGFSAFLLCKRLSGSYAAGFFGGLLFGFSPFVLGQLLSHLNQLLIFPIPLAVYLVVGRLRSDLSRNRFVVLLTFDLAMLFLLVLEPFAVMTFIAGVLFLFALRITRGEVRRRILRLIPEIAAAYLATCVLMSPYVYFYFAYGFPGLPLWPSAMFSTDLLNFVVPTSASAIGNLAPLKTIADQFPGTIFEQGGCIGIPLFAITLIWYRRHSGELLPKILLAVVAVSCVLALGPIFISQVIQSYRCPGS